MFQLSSAYFDLIAKNLPNFADGHIKPFMDDIIQLPSMSVNVRIHLLLPPSHFIRPHYNIRCSEMLGHSSYAVCKLLNFSVITTFRT